MLEYLTRAYAPMVPRDVTLEVDNHDDCSGPLSGKMASSFAERVLRKINGLILSQEALKQLALSMMMGQPHISWVSLITGLKWTGLDWTGLDWTHENVRNKLINHRKQN